MYEGKLDHRRRKSTPSRVKRYAFAGKQVHLRGKKGARSRGKRYAFGKKVHHRRKTSTPSRKKKRDIYLRQITRPRKGHTGGGNSRRRVSWRLRGVCVVGGRGKRFSVHACSEGKVRDDEFQATGAWITWNSSPFVRKVHSSWFRGLRSERNRPSVVRCPALDSLSWGASAFPPCCVL